MSDETIYTIIGFAAGVLFVVVLTCITGLLM